MSQKIDGGIAAAAQMRSIAVNTRVAPAGESKAQAVQAAGQIHTDMEKGFIRAEVVAYNDLMQAGSFAAVPKLGLMRLQGRDYEVQDGDIIHFRFNV